MNEILVEAVARQQIKERANQAATRGCVTTTTAAT